MSLPERLPPSVVPLPLLLQCPGWIELFKAPSNMKEFRSNLADLNFFVRVSFFCASMLVTAAVGGIMFRGSSVRLKHSFERDISGTPQRNFPHFGRTIRLDSGIS